MLHTAYIAVGANLGAKRLNIEGALELIRQMPTARIAAVSRLRNTKAVGGPAGQPDYINGVIEARTELLPQELMDGLLEIEKILGRDRTKEVRFGPRVIDLDLLLFDDVVLNAAGVGGLMVPHPRMQERLFVLEPLAEISPGLVHPVLRKTIAELIVALKVPAEKKAKP